MESNNPRLVLRPGGAATAGGGGALDETQVALLVSMGFGESEAIGALWKTGGAGGIQPAIDIILQERDLLTGAAVVPGEAAAATPPSKAAPSPSTSAAQAVSPTPPSAQRVPMSPSAAAGAGTPSSASKLSSSFNTQARDDHARKEQEELAKRVKVEQALKKDAQAKIKMQMAEDKIVRRLTQTVRKASSLGVADLERARQEIAEFIQAHRASDELTTISEQLGNVIASRSEGGGQAASTAAAAAAPAAPAAAAAGGGAGGSGGGSVACSIRVRLEDGSQVTNAFQSTDAMQAVHDWVAGTHGDPNFALIVPGPPSIRREFGPAPDTMVLSLRDAGMVPMGALTLQPLAKKDLISKAPDGAEFVSNMGRGRGMGGGRGGMFGMGGMRGGLGRGRGLGGMMGMGGYDEDEDEDEDEGGEDEEMGYGEEDEEDEEASNQAFAQAQTASLEAATDARFASSSSGAVLGSMVSPIEELGIPPQDVPDDFLDPITQQYMTSPVILPSSGATLDRSTVMRHLASNPTDPYTQTPLTAQMLKPASELVARMNAWLDSKRAASAAPRPP